MESSSAPRRRVGGVSLNVPLIIPLSGLAKRDPCIVTDIHPAGPARPCGIYTDHHLLNGDHGLITRADRGFETSSRLDFLFAESSRISGGFPPPGQFIPWFPVHIILTLTPRLLPSCFFPLSALHLKSSCPYWFLYCIMGPQDQTGAKRIRGKPVPSQPGSHGPTVMNVPPPSTGSREACDECRIRKVRCNKEYPKCSSCRKSNLACGFSNKGKRVNHTKKLSVFCVLLVDLDDSNLPVPG